MTIYLLMTIYMLMTILLVTMCTCSAAFDYTILMTE